MAGAGCLVIMRAGWFIRLEAEVKKYEKLEELLHLYVMTVLAVVMTFLGIGLVVLGYQMVFGG